MKEIKLKAKLREEIGKEAVKKLRRQGLVPAVAYKGKKSVNIKVPAKDFLDVIHTKAGENVVINLQVEGKEASRTVIIKEIQYHPIKEGILHIDFNEISLTEAITVKVPIKVLAEAEGVKEGGVLEHILWEVEVECLPTQIPEDIPVDVSSLKIGDSILVKDLQVDPPVKILNDPETTVITLAVPHVEEAEPVKPEGELAEPEVITEKKPKEEEVSAEEAQESSGPGARKAAGKQPE